MFHIRPILQFYELCIKLINKDYNDQDLTNPIVTCVTVITPNTETTDTCQFIYMK
jgi:hypothetical protein